MEYPPIQKNITTNITIIAFRRHDKLHTTLQMLAKNYDIGQCPISIYIDGARKGQEQEKKDVAHTIEMAEAFPWKGSKQILVAPENRGLRKNIRYAIDSSLETYESTIVIEEDIVTSPFFFRFMIEGLNTFVDHHDVAAICGHCYPFPRKKFNPTEPYFLKHFACWGWATWRRSWNRVCWDTTVLRNELKKNRGHRELNFGIGEYVSGILEAEHNKYIRTWAVYAGVSFFLNDQHCLYPPETLTNNIGWRIEGSSVHHNATINPNAALAYKDFPINKDMPVHSHKDAWHAYQAMLYPPSKVWKIIRIKIRRFFAPALRPIKRRFFVQAKR